MISSLLRLFALRPFLTMAILGIPVIVLIAVGLLTIMLMKVLVFVVLPIMAAVWLVRRLFRKEQRQPMTSP
jgi:antibiotic biosynthesis monooxygenase (ABM) superfamily enzyme